MTDYQPRDNRPAYSPSIGQPTAEEIRAKAEKAVSSGRSFGLDLDTCIQVLENGETLAHFAAFKGTRTMADFEEARRRLADWEESERKRKAAEAGWSSENGRSN